MNTPDTNIISIFEYYSNSLNQDKNNFNSTKVWDDIVASMSRSLRINILTDKNYELKNKPVSFPPEERGSSFCDLNPEILNKRVLDVVRINFEDFYPNIIIRLCEEGLIEVDKNIEIIYFITKNYDSISNHLSDDAKLCLSIFTKYFFGKLRKDQRELVVGRAYLIIKHFSNYKESDWLYSDTDEIFIKDSIGLISKIKKELEELDIKAKVEYMKEIFVIAKKQIVTIDENSIGKIRGYIYQPK